MFLHILTQALFAILMRIMAGGDVQFLPEVKLVWLWSDSSFKPRGDTVVCSLFMRLSDSSKQDFQASLGNLRQVFIFFFTISRA